VISLLLGLLFTTLCLAAEKSILIANLKEGKPQTVVVYGTSLTAGGAWVEQFQQTLNQAYPEKAKFINSGKGAMWSKWGVDNLDKLVIEKKPDTVLIEFGMNDAFLKYNTSLDQAQKNLDNMIERILKANSQCEIILMVMNPAIGVHLERRPNLKNYYQIYRDVAKTRKLLLIDNYPNWEKILNSDPGLFNKYVPDGIHPNTEGCEMVITPEIIRTLAIAAKP
jgi:lysophospholipase L1-like esterase